MVRQARRRGGLSQRELARRAGVSYKTLQLVESGHDARWSTLAKIATALGESVESLRAESPSTITIETTSVAILRDGEASWRSRVLEFLDEFRAAPSPSRVAAAPRLGLSPRLRALLASVSEALCAESGLEAPWWCEGVGPLEEPWFPAEIENLKAAALIESPVWFRCRNVFVLGNFLSRA